MGDRDPLADLGHRPLIMGIMNITPDSFSGDGLLVDNDYIERAVDVAQAMASEGADILDIGGESTRPGASPVSSKEEIRRTSPLIKAIRAHLPTMRLSIDTTKVPVAAAAIEAGATILNDVSGTHQDPEMRKLAAVSGAYLIQMHNAAQADITTQTQTIGGEYAAPEHEASVADIARAMESLAQAALCDGVARERIILDPGIGFGKTLAQNLALINKVDQLKALGFPILLGPSRKSFIGRVLNLPPEERLEGTAAVVAVSVLRGAAILRVHEVGFMARVARMAHALGMTGSKDEGLESQAIKPQA